MSTESKLLRQIADRCGEPVNLDNTERRDERARLSVIAAFAHKAIAPLIAAQNEAVSFEDKRSMQFSETEARLISAAFVAAGDTETADLLNGLRHYARVIHSPDDTMRLFFGLLDRAALLGVSQEDVDEALLDLLVAAIVAVP